MTQIERDRLDRRVARLQRHLPRPYGGWLHRLRQPSAFWVRVPVGVLLVIGGLLWFLPILGLWMLPAGLSMLAYDVPPLRRPMRRALVWGERRWGRMMRWARRAG